MSIPKVIHYCWFGGNPLPEKVKNCIESWRKFCPEYEIRAWNEDNYDVHKNAYMEQAYEAGKWAFVSDYARLDIVYSHGGIYLDTDVELIKGLDTLLPEEMFLALERQNCNVATGLGFGAEKGHPLLREMLRLYDNISFLCGDGTYNLTACPKYTTDFMLEKGFCLEDRTQRLEHALVLSSEYFCPMDYHTGMLCITEQTYGIHWYEASWHDKGDKEIHLMEMKIRRRFPGKLGRIFCFLYRKTYRFLEYTGKGILITKLKDKLAR